MTVQDDATMAGIIIGSICFGCCFVSGICVLMKRNANVSPSPV